MTIIQHNLQDNFQDFGKEVQMIGRFICRKIK
jgi:hypothetical protein